MPRKEIKFGKNERDWHRKMYREVFVCRLLYCGMCCCVDWGVSDISHERAASIFSIWKWRK